MPELTHIADAGPKQTVIYVSAAAGDPVEFRRLPASEPDDLDRMLVAYGWTRVGPWARSDDMPAGHMVASVRHVK